MADPKVSFYPPRAHWWSRPVHVCGTFARRLPFAHIRLPQGFHLHDLLLALALPGYVYFVQHRRRAGQLVLGPFALLLLITVVWLDSTAALLAIPILVAFHSLSWVALFETWLEPAGRRRRLFLALLTSLLLTTSVYLPIRNFAQRHIVLPVRIQNRTLLVAPTSANRLAPGATAVFRVDAASFSGLRIEAGLVVAAILGGPGDRIVFEENSYSVNRIRRDRLELMPKQGEWVVPENHWFIWPLSGMDIRGNLNALKPGLTEAALQKLALVPESRAVGRPFRQWFWRKLYEP